jgi:hypothetical protein
VALQALPNRHLVCWSNMFDGEVDFLTIERERGLDDLFGDTVVFPSTMVVEGEVGRTPFPPEFAFVVL